MPDRPPCRPLPLVLAACALLAACRADAPDSAPDTQAPDAEAPDAEAPDAEAPDAEAPDAQAPDAQAPDAQAPAPDPLLAADLTAPGPFRAGYRTFPYTYTAPDGAQRTVDLHLWYPTSATSAAQHPRYEGFIEDPEALVDAPPAAPLDTARGYPVLAYSHGNIGYAATSAFLMRHFASHGWLAIAPDHTGNTLTDNLDPRPPAIYHLRPRDISAALDALEALPPSDPLAGLARTDRAILAGHSFGSHTCWAAAGATFDLAGVTGKLGALSEADAAAFAGGLGDPRVVGVIPMAGSIDRALFGADGHRSVGIPVLAMSGSEDPVGAEGQFASTTDLDLTWLELAGACHQAFALGGCTTLDDATAFGVISSYALAFARHLVLGDDSRGTTALLDGTRPLSATVTFRRHTP